jgi:hypothetical protein
LLQVGWVVVGTVSVFVVHVEVINDVTGRVSEHESVSLGAVALPLPRELHFEVSVVP